MKRFSPPAHSILFLLAAILAAPLPITAQTNPFSILAGKISGNDFILTFPTTATQLFTVQTCPNMLQPWTNFQSGMGDGTVHTATITNAISSGQAFYRLLIQPKPVSLVLPQGNAFAILGHSCGGIREQVSITGFNPTTGYPTGVVVMATTCSTGGRGSPPATFSASATVTWDFAGNIVSTTTPATGAGGGSTFTTTDAYGDTIYNSGTAAYLSVPVPAAPTGVTAVQSGDQFQVSWMPTGVNPTAIAASTLTATPVNSAAPVLTATVSGPATTGVIPVLQPRTTYQITVVNTTIGGASAAAVPISVTTDPATIVPSAPVIVTAAWTDLNPTGTTDTLAVTWNASVPGNSPVDAYDVTIVGSDGASTFTQTVSGTTLGTSFTVDFTPNWTVTVRAHNAAGSSPWSASASVGGL